MNDMSQNDTYCRTKEGVCPVCGNLECLCRPRFFAGQRLSENELNEMVGYVRAKNKLHNRYLHGWGTVCGLEVACDPCGNHVTVAPGYALDPCGEDIVVCEQDSVDICKLIRDCCDTEPGDRCRPHARPSGCDDVEQAWILAIRYHEEQHRGVIPLVERGASNCSCSTQQKTKSRAHRDTPPQCEPAEICEGYVYEVYPLPDPPPQRDPTNDSRRENFLKALFCNLGGPMFERICCCAEPLLDLIKPLPSASNLNSPSTITPAMKEAWFRWCSRFKQRLGDYLQRHPIFDCQLFARLDAVACPSPDLANQAFLDAFRQRIQTLGIIFLEALIACICSGLLPQCPGPVEDARIPLAVVTVRGRDCRIVSVCNWTPHRRIALTWPTMAYWFSWIPLFGTLRTGLHALCCNLFGLDLPPDDSTPPGTTDPDPSVPGAVPVHSAPNVNTSRFASANYVGTSTSYASAAFMRMPRNPASMSTSAIASALFGVDSARSRLAITDDDIAEAPEFQLLSHLAAPLTAGLGTEALAAVIGPAARQETRLPPASEVEVIALRQQVATLAKTVEAQADQIAALSKRLDSHQ
jgi:hypothetical protein